MVPIVWSDKVDYKGLLPPDSYINVADFTNVAAFVDYITRVQRTPALLKKHHDWRLACTLGMVSMESEGQRLCEYAIENGRREQPALEIPALRHCWNQSDY